MKTAKEMQDMTSNEGVASEELHLVRIYYLIVISAVSGKYFTGDILPVKYLDYVKSRLMDLGYCVKEPKFAGREGWTYVLVSWEEVSGEGEVVEST